MQASSPSEAWRGKCGSGVGADTYTSGFEGAWSSTPTRWSNEYFRSLLLLRDGADGNDGKGSEGGDGGEGGDEGSASAWQVFTGPGGRKQWRSSSSSSSAGADAGAGAGASAGAGAGAFMLTSDIALLHDPARSYQPIVRVRSRYAALHASVLQRRDLPRRAASAEPHVWHGRV